MANQFTMPRGLGAALRAEAPIDVRTAFVQKVVGLIRVHRGNIRRIATELGVCRETIRRWSILAPEIAAAIEAGRNIGRGG